MKVKLTVLLLNSNYGCIGTVKPCFMFLPYVRNMKLSVTVTV